MFRILLALLLVSILPGRAFAEESAKPVPEARGQKVNGVFDGDVEIWETPEYRQAAGKYYHGEPDGKWTFWDEAGIKITEITYRTGSFNGSVTMWHNSAAGPRYRGKLKMRGSFNEGSWQGSVLTYYPNGKLRSERVYANGVVTDAYAYNAKEKTIVKEEAIKVAQKDEIADNAYVDAIDAYIRKWAG